ncbi:class I SAM-dependent methyltransferase [Microbacterium atlanticum]|uniref:class I SAM-dependent methyltransferase n=1 Tax=Microbacterium atlanticum TaxID=2782168 RepID=UPI00188936C0|nr:class I SAM-dependent methyltransferase [Microbacterium atlanticum]
MSDAAMWDAEAEAFDEAADHGLRDPAVREAWRALLVSLIAPPPLTIVDLGCGTGSLSVLLAELGHDVTGVDFSPAMIERARDKGRSAGVAVRFLRADASAPPLPAGQFDVVVSRHVLWAMRDPAAALGAWVDLLRPGGRIVLIEGRWHTGAGLPAAGARRLVAEAGLQGTAFRFLPDPELWGGPTSDERYALTAWR